MATRPTHAELLIDQIGKLNNKSLDPTQYTVGTPVPGAEAHEVDVTITAKPTNTKYYGPQTITYERFDLETIFYDIGVTELEISGHGIVDVHGLITLLADRYNWDITPDDVVNHPLTVEDDQIALSAITATEDSYLYRGEIPLIYTNDPNIPLKEVIVVTQLNGFVPPTADDLVIH